MADIEFNWKSGKDPDALRKKLRALDKSLDARLEAAMQAAVMKVEGDAKRTVRVDTGRLRSSIASQVGSVVNDRISGYVGTNVSYAAPVEIKYPYLAPAIESNITWIRSAFIAAIDEAINEVT